MTFLLKKSSLTVNPKKPPAGDVVLDAQGFSGVFAARAAKPPESSLFLMKSGTTTADDLLASKPFAASAKLKVLVKVDPKMLVEAGVVVVESGLDKFSVAPKMFAVEVVESALFNEFPKTLDPNVVVEEKAPNGLAVASPFSFGVPKTLSVLANEKDDLFPNKPPLNGSEGLPPKGEGLSVVVAAGVVLRDEEKIELPFGVDSVFDPKMPVVDGGPKMGLD